MKLVKISLKFALLVTMSLQFGCGENQYADLIVHNASIYSVDDVWSVHEAMAIKDGRIIELGAEHQILNKYHSDNIVDAKKGFIYPGLIDAHSHMLGYGLTRNQIDLVGTVSFDDVLARVAEFISTHDQEWIQGRGWDQNDWQEKEFPSSDTLETLFPGKKIALKRIDGHAMLVSPSVLKVLGITNNTTVEGGRIVLNSFGEPSGVLVDEAMNLVKSIIPYPSENQIAQAFQKTEADCFEKGLTSICDAGIKPTEIDILNRLHQSGEVKIRVYAMYSASKEILNENKAIGVHTERLNARAIKVYGDGALGSRGANLLSPYSDDSTQIGFMITSKDSILKWADYCHKNNLQLCVHCIGTASNRNTLNAMGEILGGTNDRRWRIEHAQVVHPEDRMLFAQFNIIPSMQPTHATSDMYWIESRVGHERINWTYSINSLKNQNGIVALGTDFPVEVIDPINTYYAAVTRQDSEGYPEGGFTSNEKLSRQDALRGMTIWAAIASFEEDVKGSLEAGKFADFVILDHDLLKCGELEILETQVLQTWINGELVYEK